MPLHYPVVVLGAKAGAAILDKRENDDQMGDRAKS